MASYWVVPGLLGDLPRLAELPRLPNLERLLGRADRKPAANGYAHTLFDLFGLPYSSEQDLPTAALCYHALAQTQTETRYLLHADPIHLRPDQDRLLAFDFHHQPLTQDEARQFAEAFNQHFAADGMQLLTPQPMHWFLALAKAPQLQTKGLHEVLGRNIDWFLPEGEDAAYWRGWMNEVQMLFHQLPVNETRERQSQLPVNGLWLSGGGRLPEQTAQGFANYLGDGCLLTQGLQQHAAQTTDRVLQVEHTAGRAVLDANPQAWLEAVKQLDTKLEQAMQEALVFYPCDGEAFHWQPKMKYRWWRQNRSLDLELLYY